MYGYGDEQTWGAVKGSNDPRFSEPEIICPFCESEDVENINMSLGELIINECQNCNHTWEGEID